MGTFREIAPQELEGNVFRQIGKEWMLVAARRGDRVNMLTASWGGMGVLWNKPVVYVFLRPQRYTRELVDEAESFSLTFFGEGFQEQFHICGTRSGREIDKVKECGFTVVDGEEAPYFGEAKAALICKKLYRTQLEEGCFLDTALSEANYPEKDFHYVYVAEVTKVLVREYSK